jgi:hypothetical protein
VKAQNIIKWVKDQKIKGVGINLYLEVKDPYSENHKTIKKEIELSLLC